MNMIQVSHDIYVQLKLGGAIWWEQTEHTPSGNIGDIVEVFYSHNTKEALVIKCIVTQIIRTANSNRYVYRLVQNK